MGRPKNYINYADFEREEIRPLHRIGFSIDDLENEATFRPAKEDLYDKEPDELDFG